jgi:DNA-directed RNA polymerase subunit RPC12/RpoP
MNEKDRNAGGKDRSLNRERAQAAFSEELLNCFVCGKIYFSRHPLPVLGLQKKTFHVCLPCSRTLACSVCERPVSAETALVVEDLPDARGGTLCPECKERIFLSFRQPRKKSNRNGLRSWLSSTLGNIWRLLVAAAHFEIRFRRNRY